MRKIVVAWMALLGSAGAAEVSDGLYLRLARGEGARVSRQDGGEMILGPGIAHDQARARIRAMDNDNTRFSLLLELAESVPAASDAEGFALMVGDVHLAVSGGAPPGPGGRLALDSSIRGRAEADRVARFFQTQPQSRQRPPVRFETRWQPVRDTVAPGEPVVLRMEIRNTGDTPMRFQVGGKQRGARDNQYRFLAQAWGGAGASLPDTGDPNHHGGLATSRSLAPGETHGATVDLGGWFAFREPGEYRITALFELDLLDPASEAFEILWNDLAAGECGIVIAPPPRTGPSE